MTTTKDKEALNMSLTNTLNHAASNGRLLAKSIAEAQFGDDSPENRTISRRWSVTDTAALVGVTSEAIRKAEDAQRLPPPDMITGRTSRRMGYTIQQIDNMRDVFKTRPKNPTDEATVISICGHKGGSYKTATAVHFAQWLSMQGYRTLLIDIDPQATASLYHGYVADVNTHSTDTALPFMLGEQDDLTYAIKPTCWPGLEIIPSCLAMHQIESEMVTRSDAGQLSNDLHMMLRSGIESVFGNYDVIIVDGSPNLGMGTINMACAADVIIAPTPAELNDYMSTAQFFTMLRDLMKDIDLGDFEPDLRVLVTKLNHQPGNQAQWMLEQIRSTWGNMVLHHCVSETAEVGKGQVKMRTVFEQDKEQRGTTSAWKKAMMIWEPVFDEIMTRVVKPRWEDK